MLPSDMYSIVTDLATRYETFLRNDIAGVEVPELLAAEAQVVRFVSILGLTLLQTYVNVRVAQAKEKDNRPSCRCGQPLSIHRTTVWTRNTPFGKITVQDPYLYCKRCHDSCRPLHAVLGTDRESWSLAVQQWAVDLVSDESCGKAVAKLERHHPGVEMERTTALRMLHYHGKQARAFINDRLEKSRAQAELPPALCPQGIDELEVQFDGGMGPVATLEPIEVPEGTEPELTPVRGLPKRRKNCRWEEIKVGLVQIPGEVERLYSVQPTSGLEQSFDDLLALAVIKGWNEQTHTRAISDGARHIRPRMEDTFGVGDFRFILDRPHCKEHLSSAGEALELMTGVPAQQWAQDALNKAEVGNVAEVISELEQAWEQSGTDEKTRNDTLRREANYFRRNCDAVAYADYRAKGWSTASSEVESAHGHVIQTRVKISGAWWHPEHIDDILALRMLKANGWWQEYWNLQHEHWRTRARKFASASGCAGT